MRVEFCDCCEGVHFNGKIYWSGCMIELGKDIIFEWPIKEREEYLEYIFDDPNEDDIEEFDEYYNFFKHKRWINRLLYMDQIFNGITKKKKSLYGMNQVSQFTVLV